MEAEMYLDLNTFIHQLDARTKIILFMFSFVGVLIFTDPLWMMPFLSLILLQLFVSGAIKNMQRIRHVLIVLTFSGLLLWNLFARGDTPLFWFIQVESLQYAVSRTLLMIGMISVGMILITTTRNEELILGMVKLGLPYRVGFAISTALRLVPTIVASTYTIGQAQRSRGLDLDSGNLLERIRKYLPLLVPVFLSTIRNTNIFGMALESKGFGAREERTTLLELQMTTRDYVVLAFASMFLVICFALSFQGYGRITGLTRF